MKTFYCQTFLPFDYKHNWFEPILCYYTLSTFEYEFDFFLHLTNNCLFLHIFFPSVFLSVYLSVSLSVCTVQVGLFVCLFIFVSLIVRQCPPNPLPLPSGLMRNLHSHQFLNTNLRSKQHCRQNGWENETAGQASCCYGIWPQDNKSHLISISPKPAYLRALARPPSMRLHWW